jgi:type II secretory pathway component GspD/PulD (secretin)
MNTLNRPSVSFAFALSALLAITLGRPQIAHGQVVQNNVGAAFVFPFPEQLELGPTLDVIPYVLSDGFTINLTIIPTLTEFVGYDNPNEVLTSGITLPVGSVLVPTVLPRFRVRQVHSTVNVWDGQTVVLGGLISDSVTSIKDKVPVLGDLPLVGRFFRSESKNTQKKNLVIFVTPTIIDPAGNRMHSEDEMPFAQTSIPSQALRPEAPVTPILPTPPVIVVPGPAATTPPAVVTPPSVVIPPPAPPVVTPPPVPVPAPTPP